MNGFVEQVVSGFGWAFGNVVGAFSGVFITMMPILGMVALVAWTLIAYESWRGKRDLEYRNAGFEAGWLQAARKVQGMLRMAVPAEKLVVRLQEEIPES